MTAISAMGIEAVLLDVDGTLLDSNDAHAQSWVMVLRRHGHECSFEAVRSLIGKGGDKMLPELTGLAAEDPASAAMSEERTALFLNDFLPGLRATAGARPLLEKMRSEGLRLIVATSANKELPLLLRKAGVADLIEEAATSADAKNSKPDADIVQAALAKSGIQAPRAVMLGDTPYDIQAAQAAGVAAIALRCGGWWKDSDFVGAVGIYEDPAELLSRWPGALFPRAGR